MSELLIPERHEAHSLYADWVQEEVDFYYAPETYNELFRDGDRERATRSRAFLKRFKEARCRPDVRQSILVKVSEIKPGQTENDRSDQLQISECVASGIRYFVTLDDGILDVAEKLHESFALHVLRPVDFILLIDELSNSFDYHSLRLSGANYEARRLKSEEASAIVSIFCPNWSNLDRSILRQTVVKCATDKDHGDVKVVKDSKGATIAFYATMSDREYCRILALKILKRPLKNVLFQQLIKDLILASIAKRISRLVFQEDVDDFSVSILKSFGFFKTVQGWTKIVLTGLHSLDTLIDQSLINEYEVIRALLDEAKQKEHQRRTLLMLDLERKLWPIKIKDVDIPAYIIPIRPRWASELFDFYSATSEIFGVKESLTWSRENVYYRNVRPVSEKYPGRILWYVSADEKSYVGRCRGIVACSYLDEVVVDRVKDVWRRFKNYGVYQWEDVYELAEQEILSDIKALKFSDTEVFRNVIPFEKVNEVFGSHGRPKNTFASPVEISSSLFYDIYKLTINE